jgi:hypothetical protein
MLVEILILSADVSVSEYSTCVYLIANVVELIALVCQSGGQVQCLAETGFFWF